MNNLCYIFELGNDTKALAHSLQGAILLLNHGSAENLIVRFSARYLYNLSKRRRCAVAPTASSQLTLTLLKLYPRLKNEQLRADEEKTISIRKLVSK